MEVRSIEAIVRALNAAEVQYLIVGGLAVNAHGYERLTVDVDLVIGLQPENIIRGLRALAEVDYHTSVPVTPEQFADPLLRDEWRREKGMVVLKLWSDSHRRTPLDVFIYEPFDFRLEYERASFQAVAGDERAPVLAYHIALGNETRRLAGRKTCSTSREMKINNQERMKAGKLYAHPVGQCAPLAGAELPVPPGPEEHFQRKARVAEQAENFTLHSVLRRYIGRCRLQFSARLSAFDSLRAPDISQGYPRAASLPVCALNPAQAALRSANQRAFQIFAGYRYCFVSY